MWCLARKMPRLCGPLNTAARFSDLSRPIIPQARSFDHSWDMWMANTHRQAIAEAEFRLALPGKLVAAAGAAVWEIGHLANREIPQMPDVPGRSLVYNGWNRPLSWKDADVSRVGR